MPRNVPTRAAPTLWPISVDRAVDGAHRDHDAEHRRDDAEARQGVGRFRQHGERRVMLVFHRLQLGLQQAGQLLRRHRAVHDRRDRRRR